MSTSSDLINFGFYSSPKSRTKQTSSPSLKKKNASIDLSRSEKVNLYETIALSRGRAQFQKQDSDVKIPLISFNDSEVDNNQSKSLISLNQEQLLAELEKYKKENEVLKGLLVEKDKQLQEYCNKAKEYEAQVKELEPLKSENLQLKGFITNEIGKVNAQLAITEGKLVKIALEREKISRTPKKRIEMGHTEAKSPNSRATPKAKDERANQNTVSKAKTVQVVMLGERFISATPKQKRALQSSNGFSSPSNRMNNGFSSPSNRMSNTPSDKNSKNTTKSITPIHSGSKTTTSKNIVKTPSNYTSSHHRRNLTEKADIDTFSQRVSSCLQDEETSPRGGLSQITSSIRLETDSTGESTTTTTMDFHQQFRVLMEEINKKVLTIWSENETLDSMLLDKTNQIENLTEKFSKVENKLGVIAQEKGSLSKLLKEKIKEVVNLKSELKEAHISKEEIQGLVKEKVNKDSILAQKLREAELKMASLKQVEGELRKMVQTAQGELLSSESEGLIRKLNGNRSKSTGKLNTVLSMMSIRPYLQSEKPFISQVKNETIKEVKQEETNEKSEYFISKGIVDFSKSQSSFCSEVSTSQSNPVCFSNVGLEIP